MLILALLSSPLPGLALRSLSRAASRPAVPASEARNLPDLLKSWFGRFTTPRQETTEDRNARITAIRITPAKFVGYQGQRLSLSAVGLDYAGRVIQGAKFSWASSDAGKLQIDPTGQATLLNPGLVTVTCAAGFASTSAPLLVRPGSRPRQTDVEWEIDQALLRADGTVGAASDDKGWMARLADTLSPTVLAQSGGGDGGDFLYDELWSEPRNLVGSPRNRAAESTIIGSVLPEGSNFSFAVPLYGLGGRGLSASLGLNYNSRGVWSRRANAVTFNAVNSWPYVGFTLSFGRIVTYGTDPNTRFMLIDEDGTRHYLGSGVSWQTNTYQTNDGSHITYVGNATSGGTIYYNNGARKIVSVVNNRLLVTQIRDANGNYISISYANQAPPSSCNNGAGQVWKQAINTVTDTLGRIIQFNYDACNNLTSITVPGFGGTAQNPINTPIAHFDYTVATVSTSFSGLTVENVPTGNTVRLHHVYFPATQTGYKFYYSAYGMVYKVSLRKQMTIDGQGVISDGTETAYVNFNYPTSASSLTDAPAFTQRTESPGGVYTYATSTAAGKLIFTVTRPDASQLLLTRSTAAGVASGLLIESEIKNSSGASMSKAVYAYANDLGGQPQAQAVESYDDLGTRTKVDFDYDAYGNLLNRRDYGHQVSGQWQVRRRTNTLYKTDTAYLNAYLRNLAIESSVYDALKDSDDGNDELLARTTYTYDDYAALGGMENYGGAASPPGHDPSYNTSVTVRGNLTGRTEYAQISPASTITWLLKIDIFGNVTKEQLACCQQQATTRSGNTNWSQPDSVTKGDPAGPTLTTSFVYDFNTSATKQATDPNNLQTSYTYDAALRPDVTTYPTGATQDVTHNDAQQQRGSTLNYTEGTGRAVTATETYDGWGRQTVMVSGGGQVNIAYDNLGRVQSRTNPFTPGGTPGPATTYTYDALGRVTVTTLPGGNTVQNSYTGDVVTVTDQVNRKIKREADGLGRLVKVYEQTSAGGTPTQETSYTYDLLDRLTEVNQGNQLRKYKYDALGRLLYEKIPEQVATINDGTGVMWTSKYTYTNFSAVATRTDARGAVTTYTYDTQNRQTQVSYDVSQASGVAATPTVTYAYDNAPSSTTKGLLLTVTVAGTYTYTENFLYDSVNRVRQRTWTRENRSFTISYQYNTASQRTRLTYPSGRQVDYGHDSNGRLNGLSEPTTGTPTYINNIIYSPAGQVTAATLGNGVTETYGYDSNRLQLTTQVATRSGGPTGGLMNLSYGYQASAGQMGGGTTAGNAGQLMSISGTINATTESAGYTYDNVGRLVTSTQTTHGASAARRFAYDRWGNRTGVWDAVSGGNQIQSITLQQSGGAPTNRITSVTSGSTVNYTYDAAGNVTNDGAHTYQYDAENRVVNVDGGAAFYAYDQQNRRIKKATGTASTYYVWEGGEVIEEYNHLTGAQIVDYVYAGSRMVAKGPGSLLGGNGNTTYFLSDRLSARVLLDTNGNVTGRQGHLPYGEEVGTSGTPDKHRFTSYERDGESGTDYAINRQYGQGVGRFMQADPYRASGGPANPQSWNRYAYTTNEPINREDPTGLEPIDRFQGVPPSPGTLNACRPFGATQLLDGMDMMARFFCGGAIPSPADIIGDIVEFFIGGILTVDRNCQQAIYVSGYGEERNPAKAWKNAVGVKWVSADFVATPKGVIKIPDGCRCNISCSSASYKATCIFSFNPAQIMTEGDYGQQFPNPRLVPGYEWVGRSGPYQLISTRDTTPTGRIPTWEFVYN